MKKELSLLERYVEYINISAKKEFTDLSCTITDDNGDVMFIFQILDRIYVSINNEPYGVFEESKYHDFVTGKYVDYFKQVFE